MSGRLPQIAGTPAAPPSTDAPERVFDGAELAALRRFISSWAAQQQLPAERVDELVLAVNELATNSVRYGGGGGTLRVWREADTLLCEVCDAGHIQDSLLAGAERPGPNEPSGRGLWLVNQLCDVMQIRSSPAGTAIRVHKHLT